MSLDIEGAGGRTWATPLGVPHNYQMEDLFNYQ